MNGNVVCPMCNREQTVQTRAGRPVPGTRCERCSGPLDAAKVQAKAVAAVRTCSGCKRQIRLPSDQAEAAFIQRGNRCSQCGDSVEAAASQASPDPPDVREALRALLDELLAGADWSRIPLDRKLAIAAEVAR